MKNIKAILYLAAAMVVTACAGCASMCGDCTEVKSASCADSAVESASVKTGNAILDAVTAGDYGKFISAYDSRDAKITPDEFKASCENFRNQFGVIKGFEYKFELETPLVMNNIWVVTFERETTASGEKKVITQQLLFRLVTGEVDGSLHVIAMGFL